MHIGQLADRLLRARKARGLTQAELARRAEVSTRLVAEVERGERNNVSLATALRLLNEVGVTIRLSRMADEHSYPATNSSAARAMRAAERRRTWGGRQIRLADEGGEDPDAMTGVERLAAVSVVSRQAFAVARSRKAAKVAKRKGKASAKRGR